MDKTDIHPLASGKTGRIRFIHSDGKEHSFTSTVNELSGDRMSWFDDEPPSVGDTVSWVRSVFRDIRKKAEVIEVAGDF